MARKLKQVGVSFPQMTTSALRGRQSVRATFRLTAACIEAITVVATQLGIKQKSLFDHITEDTKLLELLAREVDGRQARPPSRVQKTYVVSRRSLRSLDEISQTFNAPRDALIELSVKRLLPVIEREQVRHRQRKQVLESIKLHFLKGQQILKETEKVLGAGDVVHAKLESAMTVYANALGQIAAMVARGEIIEDFDVEALKGGR